MFVGNAFYQSVYMRRGYFLWCWRKEYGIRIGVVCEMRPLPRDDRQNRYSRYRRYNRYILTGFTHLTGPGNSASLTAVFP